MLTNNLSSLVKQERVTVAVGTGAEFYRVHIEGEEVHLTSFEDRRKVLKFDLNAKYESRGSTDVVVTDISGRQTHLTFLQEILNVNE